MGGKLDAECAPFLICCRLCNGKVGLWLNLFVFRNPFFYKRAHKTWGVDVMYGRTLWGWGIAANAIGG